MIPVEKLLQVILAFTSTAQDAVQNKSKLLKPGSEQNKKVLQFIRRNDVTINSLCALWMLYIRAGYEKRKGDDKIPIPLYMIHCLSKYECDGDPAKITSVLSDKEKIDWLINLYKMTFTGYFNNWKKTYSKEYNDMIKSQIDYVIMNQAREMALVTLPQTE